MFDNQINSNIKSPFYKSPDALTGLCRYNKMCLCVCMLGLYGFFPHSFIMAEPI